MTCAKPNRTPQQRAAPPMVDRDAAAATATVQLETVSPAEA
jgi:hypothetical protein